MESLQSWLEEMWNVLPVSMLEKVVMVCWKIWENRNAMLWTQQCMDPRTAVRHALSFGASWQNVNPVMHSYHCTMRQHGINGDCWQPPPTGFLKMNIDVAMDAQRRRMGFGWVICDEESRVQGVFMLKLEGLYSVREAEAMGAREALSWLKRKGRSRVIVETDAQVFTRAVVCGEDLSPFGAICENIRSLLQLLPDVTFVFVKRSGNMVAHTVGAHAVCYTGGGIFLSF